LAVVVGPSTDTNRLRQVEDWVVEAIQKRPQALRLRAKLAAIYVRSDRYAEAERLHRLVSRSEPDYVGVLNNLAWPLALRHPINLEKALEPIDHNIGVKRTIPFLLDARPLVRIQSRQPDQALEDLQRAAVWAPTARGPPCN
jgi:hypothetical protein